MLQVGAVNYLNSKPLIEGLADQSREATLKLDFPSRLADQLAAGSLDVALVPSVACLLQPGYQIVSDACVAARGPVLSVKVYFRRPPAEVQSLALDVGSRTSATLARVLLAERFGVRPRCEPLALELDTTNSAADAVLLIGDRAMLPPDEKFLATWDLGQEWFEWTGLPFVFALWAARPNVDLGSMDELLTSARDRGVAAVRAIAEREAPLLQLPVALILDYLTQNLYYHLGPREREGLQLFQTLAIRHGLVPPGIPLHFGSCSQV